MHKIVEVTKNRVNFLYMGSGDFCEISSCQRTLDKKTMVFCIGDIFLKTSDDLEWVCISTNRKNEDKNSSWVGHVFDFSEDEYDDIEVRIFQPKEIIFTI